MTNDLYGVWGAAPDDVWAVGDHGTVIHWNGSDWSVTPVPFAPTSRPRLRSISGSQGTTSGLPEKAWSFERRARQETRP